MIKQMKNFIIEKKETNIFRRKSIQESRVIGFVAFLVVFVFQIILNRGVLCMRSLPDELGAVAFSADLAGYDWGFVLTHPSYYYGSGTFFLTYPFFVLIKNPVTLYKCLLGVAAFLHSCPAYIACRILQKYYKVTDNALLIMLVGILAALFTPTRATNIDNEPILIFLCWTIVYLIVVLQFVKSNIKKALLSILLAFLLAYSYLAHTRAILYSISAICVILIYRIFHKKNLVNIGCFIFSLVAGLIAINAAVVYLRTDLFTSSATDFVGNTPEYLTTGIWGSLKALLSLTGIQSFFDLLFSNIWIIFVFSCGTMFFIMSIIVIETKKKILSMMVTKVYYSCESTFYPMIFCIIGIIASLFGLCLMWHGSALSVHTEGTNLSRGHFYLRYYGNYFGPLILFFIIYVIRNWNELKEKLKIVGTVSVICVIISVAYSAVSYLGYISLWYQYDLDWFYYFAPFSGMFNSWPNTVQTLSYFCCATVVAILLFIAILYLFSKKRVLFAVIILVAALSWQYFYSVLKFDIPYAASDNYYGSVNATYALSQDQPQLFENVEQLYYYNEKFGPEYIVQFMFPSIKVINEFENFDPNRDNLILSNTTLDSSIFGEHYEDYAYVQLDENEYIYLNSETKIDMLNRLGYELCFIE